MKRILLCSSVLAAAATPVLGQALDAAAALQETSSEPRNRVGMAFRMSVNVSVDFNHIGGFAPATDPGPAFGGAYNHTYDDGYVRVDVTGNNHGPGFQNTTWNWGYGSSAQALPNPTDPTALAYHSASSPGASSSVSDNPEPGFELTYSRELVQKEKWKLGLEWAFGYTEVAVQDKPFLPTLGTMLTDRYAVPPDTVADQPLPPPGFRGTYNGPGPVISSIPLRSYGLLPGLVTGSTEFNAALFTFRLGPYVSLPLAKGIAANFGLGAALVLIDSDFGYAETHFVPGVGNLYSSGTSQQCQANPGAYVAGSLAAEIAKDLTLVAGAQLFTAGEYDQSVNGREAALDLRQSLFVTIGLSYAF